MQMTLSWQPNLKKKPQALVDKVAEVNNKKDLTIYSKKTKCMAVSKIEVQHVHWRWETLPSKSSEAQLSLEFVNRKWQM